MGTGLFSAAIEPGTGHACTNSRFLTAAFIEAVLGPWSGRPQNRPELAASWLGDVETFEIGPVAAPNRNGTPSCWLPDETFARQWASFVRNGQVSDTTPPRAPTALAAEVVEGRKVQLKWSAEADIESGLKRFNIYRDGLRIGTATGQGWNRGDEPQPIDCSMTFTDTAGETGAASGETRSRSYQVSTMNHAGLESPKSNPVKITLTGSSGGR